MSASVEGNGSQVLDPECDVRPGEGRAAQHNLGAPDLSRRQFVRNLTANLCGLALGVLSGLMLTPFWIRSFGIAAYGLVPLTNNLVAYVGVFTVVVSASIGRLITVEIARGQWARANRVFNTSLLAASALALAVMGVGGSAAAHASAFVKVPLGFERDFTAMILLATGTFALSLIQSPFAVAQYAANRVDVTAWLGAAARAVQIAVGLLLVTTVYCRPGALMVGYMAGAGVSAVAAIYYWHRFMPWCRVRWSLDVAVLREQVAFGVWNVVTQVGSLLYLQIDLVVINKMLGPVDAGQYAALSQWSLLVRSLGAAVSTVFGPSILHLYARNDVAGVVKYCRWAIRVMGLFLAPVVGIVCGLGQPLLRVWLGPEYAALSWVLLVMVIHLSVNIAVYPLFALQSALNRVRVPAIVTCIMGAGNAGLAFGLTAGWGMMGVAAAGAIMMTAKNVLFTPLYAAKCLGAHRAVFFREIIAVLATTSAVTGIGLAASRVVSLSTWPRLVLAAVSMVLAYLAIVWLTMLGPAERKQVREYARSVRVAL